MQIVSLYTIGVNLQEFKMHSQGSLSILLKGMRLYYKFTQRALSEKIDLAPSYISELETNKRSITLECIWRYCAFFDVAASEVLLAAEMLGRNDRHVKHSKGFEDVRAWVILRRAE